MELFEKKIKWFISKLYLVPTQASMLNISSGPIYQAP